MKIKNATDKGYLDGYPGDGVGLKFLGKARGSVQHAKTPTITGGGGSTGVITMDQQPTIRKLTEKECLMLQGFSAEEADALRNATENDKRLFPKSVLYRFAGNAVCVDCFVRITEQILNDMTAPRKDTLDSWL